LAIVVLLNVGLRLILEARSVLGLRGDSPELGRETREERKDAL
jgi:hypothetical protein